MNESISKVYCDYNGYCCLKKVINPWLHHPYPQSTYHKFIGSKKTDMPINTCE